MFWNPWSLNILDYNKKCETNLLENMMFSLYYIGNNNKNPLYEKINTTFNSLAAKYPDVMIKIYVPTSEISFWKEGTFENIDIVVIEILAQDFDNYTITDITFQNIIYKVIMETANTFKH
jgi:hypothetical protein